MKIPGCYYLGYHFWHRRAFMVASKLHGEHQFDLAHQVNFVSYREPGLLWQLPIPFVWGPIGGTQNIPYRFLPMFGLKCVVWEVCRNLLNRVQLRTSFRVRRAARKASAVLVANSTNQRDIERAYGVKVRRMLECGIPGVVEVPPTGSATTNTLRIMWSGTIEVRKALQLLIEAVARLPEGLQWELRVLGTGPLQADCQRRARQLGVDDRIEWLGWRAHHEALQQYQWADVFAFTSLRDTTGIVVLEALSQGVPVICFDHQGVADVVTPACGIKIPVSSPRRAIVDLTAGLRSLAEDPRRRQILSVGARQRATKYLWPRQGDRMADVYREVLVAAGSDAELLEEVNVTKSNDVDACGVLA
jgi:glycosyltransferase involved in cell wall biosynthesis